MTQVQGRIGSDFAGRIEVRLSTHAGLVCGVDINSTRPRGVAKVFTGRTPDETVGLLGGVFSLCATAQTVAGLEALEAACRVSISEPQRAARTILREAEMLTQTVLRVGMDWPRLLGVAPAVELARLALSTQAALEADLFDGRNWKVVGGALMRPDGHAVRSHVSGLHDGVRAAFSEGGLADQLLAALDARGLNVLVRWRMMRGRKRGRCRASGTMRTSLRRATRAAQACGPGCWRALPTCVICSCRCWRRLIYWGLVRVRAKRPI